MLRPHRSVASSLMSWPHFRTKHIRLSRDSLTCVKILALTGGRSFLAIDLNRASGTAPHPRNAAVLTTSPAPCDRSSGLAVELARARARRSRKAGISVVMEERPGG